MDPKRIAVEEIMTTDVVTLGRRMTIGEATTFLQARGISGAPVVDESGTCVGVFSMTDLARSGASGREASTASYFKFDPLTSSYFMTNDRELAKVEDQTVGEWMSPDTKCVGPKTSLEAAAKLMARDGIHRLLVTDGSTIRGIVSSLDIVRLVAGFARAEEPAAPGRT